MKKFVFFDCETTGLARPHLVQLGYAINNTPVNVNLYKPPVEIEDKATEAHSITNDQVAFYEPFEATRNQIKNIFEDSIPVAHNLPFDRRCLELEGVKIPDGICTLKLSRRLYPALKKHKLGYLAKTLGIAHNPDDLHNASEDVRILRELFKRMIFSIICKAPNKSGIINKIMAL